MPTLHTVLTRVKLCAEPAGLALRSPTTLRQLRVEDAYERWSLSIDRIQGAIDALAEQRSRHMLFVGW